MNGLSGEAGLISRMRRGTIEAFALQAVGAGLLFLMHAILGRSVGPEGYGVFSYALALAWVLAIVVPLGWPTAILRFTARYNEEQNWGLLLGAVRRAYQITLGSALAAALVLFGASFLGFMPPDVSAGLRFAAVMLVPLAFVGLRRKALQGLGKVRYSIIPEDIFLPLLVILGVLTLSVSTATGALSVYVAASLAAFALGSYWLWRTLRLAVPEEGRVSGPEYRTRMWAAIALPMVLGGFSQIVMNRADVILLGSILSPESVGLYGAASRIAALNVFVLNAVNTVAAPMMAASFHSGHPARARKVMNTAMLFSAVGAAPLFLAMFLAPALPLGLFGPEFTEGADLLRVLAAGQFVNAVTGPVGFALMMTGRERAFALTTGLIASGTVAGHLVLIPMIGPMGAAVVTAASVILLNSWQLLIARSSLRTAS